MTEPFVECLSQALLAPSERETRWDDLRFAQATDETSRGPSPHALGEILSNLESYEAGWMALDDDESRALYVRLLARRARGGNDVSLPLWADHLWRMHERVRAAPSLEPLINEESGFGLGVYDLRPFGFDFLARCHLLNVLDTFALEQYSMGRDHFAVRAGPGDIVIDGGAAWGDTTLYFSHLVGPHGRVIAVEFVPENLSVLSDNLGRNPALAEKIEVVDRALWSVSGDVHQYAMAGPASSLRAERGDRKVLTITVDDLIRDRQLPRVDFIKLDVEGAELEALSGSIETLRRWKPRLAVSAYHRPEDLRLLPVWLRGLDLGYRIRLEHFTSHLEETVIFATT